MSSTVACRSAASPPAAATARVWQPGQHIPQLDGVRGLAIAMVTLYRFSKEIPTDSWVGQLLHSGFRLGDRGVDLFFVLSGFLITGILLDAKGHPHFFKNFLARRSLRIFPLYFAALFLFLVVFHWMHPRTGMFEQAHQQQFFLWTYLTNVKMSLEGAWCFGYLDHFWSLAVEEHFYLFWPLVLFWLSQRTALVVACSLAMVASLSRVGFAMFSDNGVAPDVLTIFRCDALLIGSALALQLRSATGLRPVLRHAGWVCGSCLLLALACAALDKRLWTIPHTLWPLIWACLLVWLLNASQQHLLARCFRLSGLRRLGQVSYAMYVFQSPLIPITATVVSVSAMTAWTGNAILGNLLYIGVMFGLTYGCALWSWELLERHCLKLKAWFPTHGESPPRSTTGVSSQLCEAP